MSSELREFKQWVEGLEWSELQAALEFPLELAEDDTDLHHHEEDKLLVIMAKQLAPLPNAIHPCVLRPERYPHATAGGVWDEDGQNSLRRFARDRVRRPRMFYWYETGRTRTTSAITSRHRRSDGRGGKGGRSVASHHQPLYDVVARKVVVNGVEAIGGLATTEDQWIADTNVLLESVVVEEPIPRPRRNGRPRVDEQRRFVRYGHERWCEDPVTQPHSTAVNPRDVFRHLRVASRGHFLKSWPPGRWLHPTHRCLGPTHPCSFSLPMYLSCRYERSLGQHFALSRKSKTRLPEPSLCRWTWPPESLPPDLVLRRMIDSSVACALGELLKEDEREVQQVKSATSRFPSRLGLEFLLEQPRDPVGSGAERRHRSRESPSVVLDRLLVCDLSLLDTPVDKLRRATCRNVHERLTIYYQRELEASWLESGASTAGTATSLAQRGAKKGNSKKRKERRIKSQPPIIECASEASAAETANGFGLDEEMMETSTTLPPTFQFPANATSQRDRNRNTVLCLSILQDVLNAAFDSIGLEPDVDDFDRPADPVAAPNCLEAAAIDENAIEEAAIDENATIEEPLLLAGRSGVEPNSTGARSSLSVVDECANDSSDGEDADPGEDRPLPASVDLVGETDEMHDVSENLPAEDDRNAETLRRGNFVLESFGAHYATIGGAFYHRPEPGFVWEMNDDDWGRIQGLQPREQSLLADLFATGGGNILDVIDANRDIHGASSTAASVDSKSEQAEGEDELLAIDAGKAGCMEVPETIVGTEQVEDADALAAAPSCSPVTVSDGDEKSVVRSPSPQAPSTPSPTLSPILVSLADLKSLNQDSFKLTQTSPEVPEPDSARTCHSASASSLPNSPQSRPTAISFTRGELRSIVGRDSLNRKVSPSSGPHMPLGRRSKSRDDQDVVLRRPLLQRRSTDALSSYRHTSKLPKAKDDHDIRNHNSLRSADALLASRPRGSTSRSGVGLPETHITLRASPPSFVPVADHRQSSQPYLRSEIHDEGHDQSNHRSTSLRAPSNDEADNHTVTKDGSTTITSLSHRELEELGVLREERNVYRDLCLTLGAEVAKLKNLLAAQRGMASAPRQMPHFGSPQPFPDAAFFGPETVSNPFSFVSKARTLAAMSDAGYKGDHESLVSEDDAAGRHLTLDGSRQVFGSEISIDHTNSQSNLQLPHSFPHLNDCAAMSFNGTQTRLATEVMRFVESINSQLRKQEPKRRQAVERMTRLVNTVWPRAQVKLYGSHVTGLCLPSSDLDFVVLLPEVHKRAIAVAPGALEGRNAINESSQKQLARKLKGESWIDPRSMQLIERTVVPVIKVATKDTKAKTLQLDITFDCPGHHGMDAIRMVAEHIDEIPLIRPLVLVLKQFLLERGLLTSFTGGLSSYCLFLMVTRYLQEQSSAYGDGGSLLLGFLDFYGNYFDPRSLGISVRRREYFARPNNGASRIPPTMPTSRPPAMWNPQSPHFINPGQGTAFGGSTSLHRRNSFNDPGMISLECAQSVGALSRPPRVKQVTSPRLHQSFAGPIPSTTGPPPAHPPPLQPQQQPQLNGAPAADWNSQDHRIPYTFDPLWVEDPLSESNNVGRNAFRFLQVQRAFSDAHRALVAALEWDVQSNCGDLMNDGPANASAEYYPLLKSLLQSEDVVFDL